MEVQAHAKLNLTLDVLGRREDGYHDLKMIMQSVTLSDTLTLEPRPGEEICVDTTLPFLPGGEKNLAGKAAVCFYRALGRPAAGVEISIQKRIPVCAGMAGGSSDAAAVLRALNQMEGTPFTPEEPAPAGAHVLPYLYGGQRGAVVVPQPQCQLPVGTLQSFLDQYLLQTPGSRVDYIHGADVVEQLSARPGTVGFLLPPMGKEALFPTVIRDGVLPRKTFSMGEAHDKRFYLEARPRSTG